MANPDLVDAFVVRKKVLTVRRTTTTRRALRIIVTQRLNNDSEITMPTITISGDIATYMESPRYARDLGNKLIEAAGIADDWTQYVK